MEEAANFNNPSDGAKERSGSDDFLRRLGVRRGVQFLTREGDSAGTRSRISSTGRRHLHRRRSPYPGEIRGHGPETRAELLRGFGRWGPRFARPAFGVIRLQRQAGVADVPRSGRLFVSRRGSVR